MGMLVPPCCPALLVFAAHGVSGLTALLCKSHPPELWKVPMSCNFCSAFGERTPAQHAGRIPSNQPKKLPLIHR